MGSGSRVTDAIQTLEQTIADREKAGREVGATLIRTAVELLRQERSLSPKR